MTIEPFSAKYLENCAEIALFAYSAQRAFLRELPELNRSSFLPLFESARGTCLISNGTLCGYLLYDAHWTAEDGEHYRFPLWGYGATGEKREQVLSRLFQAVAATLQSEKTTHYDICLYARDEQAIRLFSFLQFGIQCETCLRFTGQSIPAGGSTGIRRLNRQEMAARWIEIWPMFRRLIDHLKESPVFYPGREFTEEVYRAYLFNENTRLYIAERDGGIIGVIDANRDGNDFVTARADTWNIGDVYVDKEFRGTRLAEALLFRADDDLRSDGVSRAWVMHGTANPNARGFWNKYFSTYAYLMIRSIPPLA